MKRNFGKAAAIAVTMLFVVMTASYFYFTPARPSATLRDSVSVSPSIPHTSTPYSAPSRTAAPEARGSSPFGANYWQLALTLIICLAMISLIVAALKTRRRDLLQSPHLVTPESFQKWTGQVADTMGDVIRATNINSHAVRESHSNVETAFIKMSQTFLTLQSALDQRDQQIKRAEQGWELQVFRKFLMRFARVDEVLNDKSIGDPNSALEQARLMMRDALEECGVEMFHPRIGSDYRTEKGVDDQPILIHANDRDLAFSIKSVTSPGYYVRSANGDDVVVIPAKVEVYVPQETINA